MVVVHKPADWEVDGPVVEEGEHPPLSAYLQAALPRRDCPLVWSAERGYGFLHRLDIPSSGLVLCGTTFEGYYSLRLQLDTKRLRREYFVLCHGLAAAELTKVAAKVDVAPDPSQRRSVNDSGKPSQTQLRLAAHACEGAEADRYRMSIAAIRIFTGRRHQIRVHLRHVGHPTVTDARYTCREAAAASRAPAPAPARPEATDDV